jgi:hypothetical protein
MLSFGDTGDDQTAFRGYHPDDVGLVVDEGSVESVLSRFGGPLRRASFSGEPLHQAKVSF